jgi:hypothetical protein
MKPIDTRTHGVLDYLTAATLAALPMLFDWPQRVDNIFWFFAAGTLLYSLCTRYELGVFRTISMRGHLMLDFLSGVAFLLMPLLVAAPDSAETAMVLIGAFEIGAVMLSQTEPARRADAGRNAGDDDTHIRRAA